MIRRVHVYVKANGGHLEQFYELMTFSTLGYKLIKSNGCAISYVINEGFSDI